MDSKKIVFLAISIVAVAVCFFVLFPFQHHKSICTCKHWTRVYS